MRLMERVNEQSGKDINLHMFKDSVESNHRTVKLHEFVVHSSCYCYGKF